MARYASLLAGFNITTASAIDKRLILTKEEMRTLVFEDTKIAFKVPTHTLHTSSHDKVYLAICAEDKRLYLYDESVAYEEATGYFHPIASLLDFTDSEEGTLENFENAIKASTTIADLEKTLKGTETQPGLTSQIESIQKQVEELIMNGGEIT